MQGGQLRNISDFADYIWSGCHLFIGQKIYLNCLRPTEIAQ